jgi:hypothetical protein
MGQTILGTRFTDQVRKNAQLICDTAAMCNVAVVDLSLKLDSSGFLQEDNMRVIEHLNASGRKFIAEKLATEIQQRRQYKSAPIN